MTDKVPGRIYDAPRFYEIAYSFRDIPAEADVFERIIECSSKIPVRRFLEIACGPAAHMPEIMRRGYEYTGIDLNPAMLAYAGGKAARAGLSPTLLRRDLVDFSLEIPCDFAFILLGSLYVSTAQEFLGHLDSMARALRPGGLYLLHFCVQFNRRYEQPVSWVIEREGVRVENAYSVTPVNEERTVYDELISLKVDDRGEERYFEERFRKRLIFAGEFRKIVAGREDFEFVGWWNSWNLDEPISDDRTEGENSIDNQIVVVRRT